MPLKVYRLRRWLAATAVLFTLAVAGVYLYARLRQHIAIKQIPGKIGIDIKRTANGFKFSKSDGKRTLFTIQASDLKEFKLNGRAELHNVSIVLYGRDSSRFDRISGDEFAYDQKSGDITAKGEVQIDLEANPSGLTGPDQASPKEIRNPIHLKTRDLVFNRETGSASTPARVEFHTLQASGWAVGVQYGGKNNALTLTSQIHIEMPAAKGGLIEANRGVITNDPRMIVLDHAHVTRRGGTLQADRANVFLDADNNVKRVLAVGGVDASSTGDAAAPMQARADQAELALGPNNLLRNATLTGNVHLQRDGPQSIQGTAGRVVLDFGGENTIQKVHALDRARLTQHSQGADAPEAGGSSPQDFEMTAQGIDFFVEGGRRLDRAVTSGAAQITVLSVAASKDANQTLPPQRTVITARTFDAHFDTSPEGRNRLAAIHGAPDAKIVSVTPGQPDRVSTSQTVDATFLARGGIESITQQGNLFYTDNLVPEKRMQAWADRGRYTPSDQLLVLTGSPRVNSGGMTTTANTIRINRAISEAVADGDVKSTYSELKEQPDGALLASPSPIHVSARSMTSHNSPAVALYTGNARLWQDANVIQAPSIQFARENRAVTAQGTAEQPVSTLLIQRAKNKPEKIVSNGGNPTEKSSSTSPIAITALKLTYADADRKAHYEGGVVARGQDFTASARTVDAYLVPHSQAASNEALTRPGQLDRMVAQGDVIVQQPGRKALGQSLLYTTSDDKFVLTGGPPSIFDAERGKITGVSLTFFRADGRVLVEGEANTPVVTQTRVGR